MTIKRDIDADRGMDDIRDILHNQGVADLSWLAVDEQVYREYEALPKQNLDIIPELQHALRKEPNEPVPSIIPLRPHTVVNSKSTSAPLGVIDSETSIRNRVASYVMSGFGLEDTKNRLTLEFGEPELRKHLPVIKEVIDERGLLGNVYINSSHFPRCAQGGDNIKVANDYCKHAVFVVARQECSDCVCNNSGVCSSFKKRLVSSVPYDERLFGHYSKYFDESGRKYSSVGDVKERLRASFLSPVIRFRSDVVQTVRQQDKPVKYNPTETDVNNFLNRQSQASVKLPGPAYMAYARRMMAGFDDRNVLLSSTDSELRTLSNEYGLLGYSYLDMDALGGCRKTLSFIKERNLSPDYIVKRNSSCEVCKNLNDGACSILCKSHKITKNTKKIERSSFACAIERALQQNRITFDQARVITSNVTDNMDWRRLTSQLNVFEPASGVNKYASGSSSFFHGRQTFDSNESKVNLNDIRIAISHFLNVGLKGSRLVAAITNMYTKSDLVRAPEIGLYASNNDGVQGYYFIDPSVYPDYGQGCSRGSSMFKKNNVPYLVAGDKCTGCTYQLVPGKCSKYAKDLLRSIPDEARVAFKKKNVPITKETVENPIEKYELASELSFDVESVKSNNIDINIEPFVLTD